jgi:hypothetical protein
MDCETGVGINPGITQLDSTTAYFVASTSLSGEQTPVVTSSGDYLTFDMVVIPATTGTQGDDPEAMLRWSDDGGHTWSNEHWSKMGAIGQYGRRVFWRRLGMTMKLRDRVYEVSGTDPVKIAIVGAELLLSPTRA